MPVTIETISADELARYFTVSSAFRVESVLEVEAIEGEDGGFRLTEVPLAEPYVKDYDALEPAGAARWRDWDLTYWRFLLAEESGRTVGAAAVAHRSPGIRLLEDRDDLAALWDLRVAPSHRRRGIGARLFDEAAAYARACGCTRLEVETQHVNVPACAFYASRGCRLGTVDRDAYREPEVRHEIMLLWHLDLRPRT